MLWEIEYEKAIELSETDYGIWETGVEINSHQTILYKYAIKDKNTGKVFYIEPSENRWVFGNPNKDILYVKADHYFKFDNHTLWHSAGVATSCFLIEKRMMVSVLENFPDIKKFRRLG